MNCPNCNSPKVVHRSIRFRCQQCQHSWYISSAALRTQLPVEVKYQPRENTTKFAVYNHQGKADAYVKALNRHGYTETVDYAKAMFLLTDSDIVGRAGQIHRFYTASNGAHIFLYPHTGRPMLQWDGMYRSSPYVTAAFCIAEGHAEVPRRYGYSKPMHPVGWSYCRMRKFKKRSSVSKVLFAPIHANGNGYLSPEQRDMNGRAFDLLYALRRSGQIELTVRYLHKLEWNNIPHVRGVRYLKGKPDQSFKEIDAAHVVVSKQNMQYIAVARGVPTVGMDEDHEPVSASSSNNLKHVASWEKYREYMQFPLDIFSADDTMKILTEAAASDAVISEWRDRFIGQVFDGDLFVEKVESYL